MTDQLTLLAEPAWMLRPRTDIERRFVRFHRDNPHVFEEFRRRAMQAYTAGATRIGAKAIAERLRWDVHVRTLGDDYKINNSFVALYARLLIHREPRLSGIIETRRRRSA